MVVGQDLLRRAHVYPGTPGGIFSLWIGDVQGWAGGGPHEWALVPVLVGVGTCVGMYFMSVHQCVC